MPNNQDRAPEIAQALLNNGFRVVPLPHGQKGPKIPKWQERGFDENDFDATSGIGIKTGKGIVAIDVDCYSSDIVDEITAEFERRFGKTLRRTGCAPKTALLASCDIPKKVIVKLSASGFAPVDEKGNGKTEQVEVLTGGQQLVAFGVHPDTGKPYHWHGNAPWVAGNALLEAVPNVTTAALQNFLDWIEVEYGHPATSGLPSAAKNNGGLAALTGYVEPETVGEGGRNNAVLQYVGHLRGKGVPESLILGMAANFNSAKCKPPLDKQELGRIVASYAVQGNPEHEEWPEPQALGTSLPAAPHFDYTMLPDVLVDFVRDASERMGVPPDYIAVPSMLAAAAALGSGWAICPKAYDKGWKESAVLWGGIVAPPGSKKSPCLQLAAKPLQRIEAKLNEKYAREKAMYLVQKKTTKGDSATMLALVEPKPERATVQDVTYQKLAELCSTSPKGLMAQWDEVAGMVSSWNAKGQEAARGFYLTAWSGDQPYIVDRKEGGTTRIERLFIVISGGVQPGVLGALVRDAKQNGASNDGLIQRFQMMVYPDEAMELPEVDRAADEIAQNRACDAIERLRSITPATIAVEEERYMGRGILHFTDNAQMAFNKLREKIERKVREPATHPLLASHFAKMPGALAKLAMLIHLLDGGTGNVPFTAVEKAAKWSIHLRRHAERVYALSQVSIADGAERVLKELKAGALPNGFTAFDVARKGWADLKGSAHVEDALSDLVKAGWLRPMTGIGEGGGRPTTRYMINPKAFEG